MPPFSLHCRRLRPWILSAVCAVFVLIGCGTAADSDTAGGAIPAGYPTIASPDFHGTFEITGGTAAGQPLVLDTASTRQVSFDVVTGAATVDLGCEQRLGSFTLDADGWASITLTGRVEIDPCQPSDLDDAIVELTKGVERWQATDGGFRLLAAGGGDLILTRR